MTSKKSIVIWVDSDGYVAAPQYKSVMLTSVIKRVDRGVSTTILQTATGKFSNSPYLGTMKNKGTALASYHDLIRRVPTALRKEVSKLGNDLRNGKIQVK